MIFGTDDSRRHAFFATFRRLANGPTESDSDPAIERSLFATVDDETFPGCVLPRRLTDSVAYYALADSGQDWRHLAPLLKAFVGVTVTDFTGQMTPLNFADPLDAWLATAGFAAVARFSPGEGKRPAIAKAGLLRLRDCLSRADIPRRVAPRTTRQALEDFRLALVALDRVAAERTIEFLRLNYRLDAMNLRFLEVQLDATFGDWERLLRRKFIGELCYARRPPGVSAALIEAVYHTFVEPAVAIGPFEALEAFREKVLGRYGNLFTMCPPFPRPAVAVMFLFAATAGKSIDRATVDRLTSLTNGWAEKDRRWFESFLTLVPSVTTPTAPGPSWDTFLRELESARDESAPPSITRARAILIAAAEVQTLDAYRTATAFIGRLAPDERQKLTTTPGYAGLWADIARYLTDDRVPRNWPEWIELLPTMSYEQAQRYAERAAVEWPVVQTLPNSDAVSELAGALDRVPGTAVDRLDDALPDLVTWVQSDEDWPNTAYVPIYEQLVFRFLLSNRRSANALQALLTLIDGLLSIGLPTEDYRQLMEDLSRLARELNGIRYLDWLIDLAEVTANYACPDPTTREAVWSQIIATILQFRTRLSPTQRVILDDLAGFLGLRDKLAPIEPTEAESEVANVRLPHGFCVAIYTLTEQVGARAVQTLRRLHPDLRIELLHDKVASTRLIELARTADLFVVCWRTAKHAATDAIRQKRGDDQPTIFAVGKGSSSIIAEIETHLLHR